MYVCESIYSVSIQFFSFFFLFCIHCLYIHWHIFLWNTHRFPLSIFAYFFRIVVSLCPTQFTFCCCLSAFVLLSLSVSILAASLSESVFRYTFNLLFSNLLYKICLCFLLPLISLYFCCFFLTFLSLCLLRLPTFCILNHLVPVPLYCPCVIIIYQHFIVYWWFVFRCLL